MADKFFFRLWQKLQGQSSGEGYLRELHVPTNCTIIVVFDGRKSTLPGS